MWANPPCLFWWWNAMPPHPHPASQGPFALPGMPQFHLKTWDDEPSRTSCLAGFLTTKRDDRHGRKLRKKKGHILIHQKGIIWPYGHRKPLVKIWAKYISFKWQYENGNPCWIVLGQQYSRYWKEQLGGRTRSLVIYQKNGILIQFPSIHKPYPKFINHIEKQSLMAKPYLKFPFYSWCYGHPSWRSGRQGANVAFQRCPEVHPVDGTGE